MSQLAPLLATSALSALVGGFIGSSVSLHFERAPRGSASVSSAPGPAPLPPRFEQVAACYSREIDSLRTDLRRILREELAQAAPSSAASPLSPDAGAEPQAQEPPSSEALDAEQRAQDLVDGALARRNWTNDDAAAMRSLLGRVTAEQREDLLGALIPAMNDGRVKNLASGSPF